MAGCRCAQSYIQPVVRMHSPPCSQNHQGSQSQNPGGGVGSSIGGVPEPLVNFSLTSTAAGCSGIWLIMRRSLVPQSAHTEQQQAGCCQHRHLQLCPCRRCRGEALQSCVA